jgi:hypothetical protein
MGFFDFLEWRKNGHFFFEKCFIMHKGGLPCKKDVVLKEGSCVKRGCLPSSFVMIG